MKNTLKNSGLVLVLVGLLSLPLFGVTRVDYKKAVDNTAIPVVLGKATLGVKKTLKIESQQDLVVNLSKDSKQVIYNVLPKEYENDKYQVLTIIPNSDRTNGVSAYVENNGNGFNLAIELSNTEESPETLKVILLVISK